MKYLKLTTAMIAVLSLSACFGSDKDKTAEAPVVVEPPLEVAATFEEKTDAFEALNEAKDEGTRELGFEDIPATGSANYVGIMELPDPSATGSLLGDGYMTVNFGTAGVTGSAGNFTNSMDEAWDGSLDVVGSFFNKINVDGTLTSEAGVETEIAATAEGHTNYGNLVGQDQTPQWIAGYLEGTATTGDETPVDLNAGNTGYVGVITN